jgi:hypothetical protein
MKTTTKLILILLFGLTLATGLFAFRARQGGGDGGPPPIPNNPAQSPLRLVEARRYTLDEPYVHFFRMERPQVRSGYLLVLEVDPDLVHPRQVAEPVLYVGRQTAERVNRGELSGHVVALVPGDFDLAQAPAFFGPPALPEEQDAARIDAALEAAVAAGVAPWPAPVLEAAAREPVHLPDYDRLLRLAADLIEEYSPQEVDLIRGLRVPVLGGR